MKKLALEYEQKYVTPQNVLAIKFVTYNYEAAVAFDTELWNDFDGRWATKRWFEREGET